MDEKYIAEESRKHKEAVEAHHKSLRDTSALFYGDQRVEYDHKTGTLKPRKK
jgi:hypothetical protein